MNAKLLVGGTLMVLLATSMTVDAHHIASFAPGPIGGAHDWNSLTTVVAPVGVPPFFNAGDVLLGLNLCEQERFIRDDVLGENVYQALPAAAQAVVDANDFPTPAFGGPCFASSGWTVSGGACVRDFTDAQGRSNGFGSSTGATCPPGNALPIGGAAVGTWTDMQSVTNAADCTSVAPAGVCVFSGQIDGVSCSGTVTTGNTLHYDEQFAYTAANGHVALFMSEAPTNPLTTGTYTTASGSAPTAAQIAACGASPAPMAMS